MTLPRSPLCERSVSFILSEQNLPHSRLARRASIGLQRQAFLITRLKVRHAIALTREALAEGQSVVISLQSTGEAAARRGADACVELVSGSDRGRWAKGAPLHTGACDAQDVVVRVVEANKSGSPPCAVMCEEERLLGLQYEPHLYTFSLCCLFETNPKHCTLLYERNEHAQCDNEKKSCLHVNMWPSVHRCQILYRGSMASMHEVLQNPDLFVHIVMQSDDVGQTVFDLCRTSHTFNDSCHHTSTAFQRLCKEFGWASCPDNLTYRRFFLTCCAIDRQVQRLENIYEIDHLFLVRHMLNSEAGVRYLKDIIFPFGAPRLSTHSFRMLTDEFGSLEAYRFEVVQNLTHATILKAMSEDLFASLPPEKQRMEDVLHALFNDFNLIKYKFETASEHSIQVALRFHADNRTLMTHAVSCSGRALECASDALKRNEDFVSTLLSPCKLRAAVKKLYDAANWKHLRKLIEPLGCRYLRLLHPAILANQQFWLNHITSFESASYCLYACLHNGVPDRDVVKHALTYNGTLLKDCPPHMANDDELVSIASEQNCSVLGDDKIPRNVAGLIMYNSREEKGVSATGIVGAAVSMQNLPKYATMPLADCQDIVRRTGYVVVNIFDHSGEQITVLEQINIPLNDDGSFPVAELQTYYNAHNEMLKAEIDSNPALDIDLSSVVMQTASSRNLIRVAS